MNVQKSLQCRGVKNSIRCSGCSSDSVRYLINFIRFTQLCVSLIFTVLRMYWFLNAEYSAPLNITSLSLKFSNTILLNLI